MIHVETIYRARIDYDFDGDAHDFYTKVCYFAHNRKHVLCAGDLPPDVRPTNCATTIP